MRPGSDDAGPPPNLGPVRAHAPAGRARPLARKGLRDRRPDRVASPASSQPRLGPVSTPQHSRTAGPALPPASRPTGARALYPGVGPRPLAQAPARATVAGRSSALLHRLVSAVRAGPEPRRA